MSTPSSERPSTGPFRLPAKLDLATAADLRATLVDLLEGSGPVALDASAVTSVDTASLQILCAFARDAADAGRPYSWQATSPALLETARRLGLANVLTLG